MTNTDEQFLVGIVVGGLLGLNQGFAILYILDVVLVVQFPVILAPILIVVFGLFGIIQVWYILSRIHDYIIRKYREKSKNDNNDDRVG